LHKELFVNIFSILNENIRKYQDVNQNNLFEISKFAKLIELFVNFYEVFSSYGENSEKLAKMVNFNKREKV